MFYSPLQVNQMVRNVQQILETQVRKKKVYEKKVPGSFSLQGFLTLYDIALIYH